MALENADELICDKARQLVRRAVEDGLLARASEQELGGTARASDAVDQILREIRHSYKIDHRTWDCLHPTLEGIVKRTISTGTPDSL
jgi:hypothetical protein